MADGFRVNESNQRFELEVDGHVAEAFYRMEPGVITFTHTGVPDALGGKGVGTRLAQLALDWAREQGLRVVPQCPFIAAFMKRHKEYEDLRAD